MNAITKMGAVSSLLAILGAGCAKETPIRFGNCGNFGECGSVCYEEFVPDIRGDEFGVGEQFVLNWGGAIMTLERGESWNNGYCHFNLTYAEKDRVIVENWHD